MNMKLNNAFRAVIGMIALAGLIFVSVPASAQTAASQLEDKEIPVQSFTSVCAGGDFEITLVKSDACNVRLTVDKELSPYIDVFVKASTLYFNYDSKSVPKDTKKLYRGKDASTPVFRAVVYMPELAGLTLTENASVTGTDEFGGSSLLVSVTDKAQIKSLSVIADAAKVGLKKNAQAVLTLRTEGSVEISTENNANAKVYLEAGEVAVSGIGSSVLAASGRARTLNLASAGTAQITLNLDVEKSVFSTEGSSKILLSGQGESIALTSARSSSVDASGFTVDNAICNLSGSATASVVVNEVLEVQSLTSGSSLYYGGTPQFVIGKIIKSTLAPIGTK